jgi:hypothetical protein
MVAIWFPWIFVGGIVFIALSFTAAKYKDKDYKKIQALQDFISGSILIGFVGVLMPDVFPKIELPSSMPMIGANGMLDGGDFDLQVGPPRLAGR